MQLVLLPVIIGALGILSFECMPVLNLGRFMHQPQQE